MEASAVEMAAHEALAAALKDAEPRLAAIQLTGADLVKAMRQEVPEAVRRVYSEAARDARQRLRAATQLDLDPFTDDVPPSIDGDAIQGAVAEARRDGARARFSKAQEEGKKLGKLLPGVEAEIQELGSFDARLAVGSFVIEHGLTAPTWGDAFLLDGALNLALPAGADRVAYRLGATAAGKADPASRIALLTGANSGGKTTLLETIVQIVALAHAGLPVPAEKAILPEFDAIHLYAEKRSLGAGAFESFLRRFFPVAFGEGRVLVLADELESMTELEAAAEILAAFLEKLAERDAYAVVATHMAPHVLGALRCEVRVDGIEATGLDENGQLVVARSPVLGRAARSTPELILRRLARDGPKDLRETFGALAERVAASGKP